MLWQVSVFPHPGQPDLEARRVASEIEDLGMGPVAEIHTARGYLLEGNLTRSDVERIGRELLADSVIEVFGVNDELPPGCAYPGPLANVLLKPGVMDPVAASVEQAIAQLGLKVTQVRTLRRYWIAGWERSPRRQEIAQRTLANDAIEQIVWGPLDQAHLPHATPYRFRLITVPIRSMDDLELDRSSREGQLSLSLVEMRTIQRHFREVGRDPSDAELETIAQTWSEHCSHKTLRGRIDYEEVTPDGRVLRREQFDNLLKETIFQATHQIRTSAGPDQDWCVSVFQDNAGVVRFDDTYNVCFKVETHNHPSAIEPYGGANTGIGGVIRDSLGTGLGAKPVASTDVFCFAPPDYPPDQLPPGVLHPRKVMKGVVAGVRDYGNRMGIPTVNGAIYFDERYLGNPLVFCGNLGLIPRDRSHKEPKPGDLIVAVGGRTGRDGIHGATFSSLELTHESEGLSGGAVQIGNAITEKMLLDVILAARDRGLYHAITDCGAGGFSSAVGEMAEAIGAVLWLERVPLKYQGLSYTEIWISEAQERMVLAVPETHWPEFHRVCASEGVEATVVGRFEPTGRLTLKYDGHTVGDLELQFLHHGRPPVVRTAVYSMQAAPQCAARFADTPLPRAGAHGASSSEPPYNETLRRLLSAWNVCSKEWVVRQYDHEVQGGSVVKPLVGARNDGPSDAAVIRPVLGSYRGLAIACGTNPRYGSIDPYWMAASAIDEAVRNCVAVGARPDRIAILDNFCWGNTDRPEELGTLVRAALACRDIATAYGTPFVSGKDSLNNEFRMRKDGQEQRIVIPPTLLISAMGQIDDVRTCVTMDLKEPGSAVYLIGITEDELGGSHFYMLQGLGGGNVPRVNANGAPKVFARLHEAIRRGLVRSCHDLSEGGLAVAAAETALAGGMGIDLCLDAVVCGPSPKQPTPAAESLSEPNAQAAIVRLFSESNTRFLVEVAGRHCVEFDRLMEIVPTDRPDAPGFPAACIARVTEDPVLHVSWQGNCLVHLSIAELQECWQRPLRW